MQRHVPNLTIEAYCLWEHDMLQVWISSLIFSKLNFNYEQVL
jgi:hypothetical protein